jgi:hypothetical protein
VAPGAVTATVAEPLAVPPGPVQERENVLDVVNAALDSLPEVALLPAHAPEAVQEAASVEDQVSMVDAPLTTEAGFAVRDTVGIGGGGGVPDTVTVTDLLALPPEPLQVREYPLLVVSVPVD